MKHFEKLKYNISECSSALEMIGILDATKVAAIIYCKKNCPDEILIGESGEVEDISIFGMVNFFESEVSY